MTDEEEDRALDAALQRWAIEPAGDEAAIARILRHGDELARPSARPRWWLAAAGAAVAASVALVLLQPAAGPEPAPPVAAGDDGSVASFLLLHAPTPYEESLL